jgi:hypothetical protein
MPSDAQPTTDAALLAGRYQLLDKLGAGGMGAVFRARDIKLDRHVAVKLLPQDSAPDPDAVARFRREARALARLTHPGIIHAYDSGEDNGRPFLVMELVEGRSLAAVLRDQGHLAPTRAADCAYQAALALHYAHQSGLVHRDVKPSNLLLSADGRVRLLDLGLARFLQDQIGEAALTRTGSGLGTPDYAPPEQFRDARRADARSDVYALGCTLYHLIAGRVPFPGSSFSEKVEAHESKEPTPLEELCPEVPTGLALAVRKMMAKRPADRFQSMADVAEALMPHVAGSSASFPQIRHTATWDRNHLATMPAYPLRRRLAAVGVAAAAAVLLLAAGVLAGLAAGWSRPGTPQVAQERPAEAPAGETAKAPPAPPDTGTAKPPDEPKKGELPREPNLLTVSQAEEGGGQYRTINDALREATKGQTIRVLDGAAYEESLFVSRASVHEGLTLEAVRGATLQPPEAAPAVVIQDVPGVTLRGFKVRRLKAVRSNALLVSGRSPGCLLEDLEFLTGQGSGVVAVSLEQLSAAEGRAPVTVRRCRFHRDSVGVQVSGTASACAGVAIRDNVFEGGGADVVVRGHVERVAVVGNRHLGASAAGVSLYLLAEKSCDLLVANNTYVECYHAIRLSDGAVHGRQVRVCNNLVLDARRADFAFYRADQGTAPANQPPMDGRLVLDAWTVSHNWREVAEPPPGTPFARAWVAPGPNDVRRDEIKGVNRDPKSPDYLRPDPQSKLAAGGAGDEDPSLPRYVGALPPQGMEPWDWERAGRMPTGARLLTVSGDEKDGGTYRTINGALAAAKPWDTVRVLDAGLYQEKVVLDQKEKHEGLTLEAPRGATIVMSGGVRQALSIRDVPWLRVSGFRIRQAEDQKEPVLRVLVQVRGPCAGLRLEGLELRPSFMARAASLEGVSALPGAPLLVSRCLVDGGKGQTDGIHLAGSLDQAAAPSGRAILRDNRIKGVLQGIHLQGALADVQVAGNIISQCRQEGIGLSDLTAKAERCLIANNTLYGCGYGVRGWVDGPYDVTPGQVELRNNLVLEHDLGDMTVMTGAAGGVGTPSLEKGRAAAAAWRFGGNWRDLGGTAHLIPLAGGDHRLDSSVRLPLDPARDDFLRPPPGSPVAGGGAGKDDPSLPTYAGAVPPEGALAWDWDRTWRARLKKAADGE